MAKSKDKTVWVRNNGSTSILVRAVNKDGKEMSKTLSREAVDRVTNEVKSRGYTSMSVEEFEFFKENSPIFRSFVDKGTLVMYESAPEEAFSDAERIVILETKITELEGKLAAGTDTTALEEAEKKARSFEEQLTAANEQIVELQKELDSYKNQFKDKE